MTKENLQKELKDKVKPGVKPSDLRKLKRSKSADDIPQALSQSVPLSKSQSQSELPLTNQKSTITQLQDQVRFYAETAANYLKSLSTSQAKVSELEQQLKNNLPNQTELDNSLFARHKNLKDWFTQYQKSKELDSELANNIEEASEELISQDNLIANLRKELSNLKLTNHSLQKDLNLAQKLAEYRKVPFPENSNSYPFLKYALYSLAAVLFTYWLVRSFSNKKSDLGSI